jgi:hypothetical protein
MTFLLAFLVACGGNEPTEAPPPAAPPAAAPAADAASRAAEIARAIDADPSRADAILKEKGMTAADLDALMYEVAADPALTDRYVAARGR